ncbi:hypothetical protein LINPERHAP2_LOCUS32089, partial [Linum perenne]
GDSDGRCRSTLTKLLSFTSSWKFIFRASKRNKSQILQSKTQKRDRILRNHPIEMEKHASTEASSCSQFPSLIADGGSFASSIFRSKKGDESVMATSVIEFFFTGIAASDQRRLPESPESQVMGKRKKKIG